VTKRGDAWRAQIRLAGYKPVSRTFPSKAAARRWATTTEAELLAGRRGEIIPRSVRAALKRYATEISPKHRGARWEQIRLAKFEREISFVDRQLTEVRPSDIAAWRDRSLERLASASVRREMVLLRLVFEACRKEWGWLASNPMDGVKWADKGRARFRRVTDAEIAALRTAAHLGREARTATQRVVLAFLWAIETAMRAGEICGLRAPDLHPTWAHLGKTKNGDERDVPLSRAALRLLNRLPPGPRVFDLSSKSLDALFRSLRDRAGIVDLHFHDSRHEAITRLARKLNVPELARMVGTRDLKTLMVYFNPSAAEIARRLD